MVVIPTTLDHVHNVLGIDGRCSFTLLITIGRQDAET